ncbi:MAG TPA: anti-sigma factor [Blastocatellia bacterium]|nr:anti-sigma factor [Blastocatellia bacterium]
MKTCGEIRARLAFYLDDELHGGERVAFESHVGSCAACREAIDVERTFLESVRAVRPLYAAPFSVRERVEEIVAGGPQTFAAPPELRSKLERSLGRRTSRALQLRGARRLAAPVVLIAMVVAVVVWFFVSVRNDVRARRPSEFAKMATDTHQRHQRGQLPLEVETESPEAVSAWFADKVLFPVKLPNYQESSGQEKMYRLEGARLVGYKNDYAAYVAYRMTQRPISLVVTSDSVALPSGGEEIPSRGLTFHFDSIDGLKVITWSDKGLTYALVSDLEERGQQSCVVCHQGTRDQDFIEGLRPK